MSHFLLDRVYAESGKPSLAITAFNEAIRLNPTAAFIYDSRAEAYGMLGEHSLAVEDYAREIILSPGNIPLHIRKAVALFQLGRLEEAIQDLDEAIEIYNRKLRYLKIWKL